MRASLEFPLARVNAQPEEATVTQAQRRRAERVVRDLKKVAQNRPDTHHPSVTFKRDWAYGNAGIENEKITRKQVNRAIKK